MQLPSVYSQMKVRARLKHKQVAETAHSRGGTVAGTVTGTASALTSKFPSPHLKALCCQQE